LVSEKSRNLLCSVAHHIFENIPYPNHIHIYCQFGDNCQSWQESRYGENKKGRALADPALVCLLKEDFLNRAEPPQGTKVYEDCRRVLWQGLQTEPDQAPTAIYQKILQPPQDPKGKPHS